MNTQNQEQLWLRKQAGESLSQEERDVLNRAMKDPSFEQQMHFWEHLLKHAKVAPTETNTVHTDATLKRCQSQYRRQKALRYSLPALAAGLLLMLGTLLQPSSTAPDIQTAETRSPSFIELAIVYEVAALETDWEADYFFSEASEQDKTSF